MITILKGLRNKLKFRKEDEGFTLIEVMMAMGLFGVIFGSIGYLLITAIDARRDAVILNQSALIARKYMDKIQRLLKEESKEGEVANFPNYRYRYEIEEEEQDIFKNDLLQDNDELKEKIANSISGSDPNAQNKDSVTAGIINTLHYQVTISHKSGIDYSLDYYRILQ